MRLLIDSKQYAVGHGSYHTTAIWDLWSRSGISYVFDCGGENAAIASAIRNDRLGRDLEGSEHAWSQSPARHEVAYWRRGRPYRGHDLLVISHLDADHVNGIADISRLHSFGRVLIPYIDSEAVIGAVAPLGREAATRTLDALGQLVSFLDEGQTVVELVPDVNDPGAQEYTEQRDDINEAQGPPAWTWAQSATLPSGQPMLQFGQPGRPVWELTPFIPRRVRETWGTFWSLLESSANATYVALQDRPTDPPGIRLRRLVDVLSVDAHLEAVRAASHAAHRNGKAKKILLNPTSIAMYSGPSAESPVRGKADVVAWLHTGDLPLGDEDLFRNLLCDLGRRRADRILTFALAHHGALDGLNRDLANSFRHVDVALSCRCKGHRHPRDNALAALEAIGWTGRVVYNEWPFYRHETFDY